MTQYTLSKRTVAMLLILSFSIVSVFADPPTPPVGKVWVLNHEMSDEFDANSPSIDKWNVFDKGNSWDRTSAFDKRIHSAVKDPKSENYYLAMNPMWYYEDERFTSSGGRTYNFAGGGMDTYGMQQYGYFEVSIKPSDFPMGSGVFMNSRGTTEGSCNEKYATELDIIENMGYTGPGAGSFNNYQHVNSHSKPYSDEGGTCHSLPYESTNSGVINHSLAEPLGFNTVGMWWKDENTAEFYSNDAYFGTITPERDFYLPMPIILTMETYSWGDDENNATNPKPVEWMFEDDFRTKEQRAVMYDWVRVWKLIDIDVTELNDATDNVQVLNDTLVTYPANQLSATVLYSCTEDREVVATLYSPTNTVLAQKNVNVTKGVKSIFTMFELESNLAVANDYKIIFELKDESDVLTSATSVVNIVNKPLEKKLFREGISTSLIPGETTYNIDVKYETDINSTVVVEIRKPDGSWFGGGNKNVTPGSGTVTIKANTPSEATAAANYFYKIYMHGEGLDWRDPLQVAISPTIYFNVEEPLLPNISIISAPAEILYNTKEIDVEFEYTTTENGILDIMLLNQNNEIIAQESRSERIGSRILTRTIAVESILTPSEDCKIAVQFSPENNGFENLVDTISNIVIKSNATLLDKSKANIQHLSLFPNPVNNQLNIELMSSNDNIRKIEIFNVNGKVTDVFNENREQALNVIDVSMYKTGMYFVKVITEEHVLTESFIKK